MKIIFLILFTALVFGCEESREETNVNGMPDFFNVISGEKVTFQIDTESKSNLPYFYFEVPLPNNSALTPYMNYSISINKKTNVVHSKSIREPTPSLNACLKQRTFFINLLEQHNFKLTSNKQVANPTSSDSYLLNSQVAMVSCTKGVGRGSPFHEIELVVTTNDEHIKFEKNMREYSANK